MPRSPSSSCFKHYASSFPATLSKPAGAGNNFTRRSNIDFTMPTQAVVIGDAPAQVPGTTHQTAHAVFWYLRFNAVSRFPDNPIKARANPALRLPAVVVALAAAALAGVRLITFAPEGRMPIEIPPEEAVGFVLANRVLEDFPDGGKVIVFQPQADENYEWTTDLDGAWTASGASDGVITVDLTVGAPTPAASGYGSVTVTVTATPATAAELFDRLRLDVP